MMIDPSAAAIQTVCRKRRQRLNYETMMEMTVSGYLTGLSVLLVLAAAPAEAAEPATSAASASETTSKKETWMFVLDQANMLPAPATRARPRGRLARGKKVRITNQTAGWFKVEEPDSGLGGWVRAKLLSTTPPPSPKLSDQKLRQMLIDQSIAEYPGNCPCPYNADRAGRSCGRRSAYSRPGGYSPKCYRVTSPRKKSTSCARSSTPRRRTDEPQPDE
jgi:hypothetical protein